MKWDENRCPQGYRCLIKSSSDVKIYVSAADVPIIFLGLPPPYLRPAVCRFINVYYIISNNKDAIFLDSDQQLSLINLSPEI